MIKSKIIKTDCRYSQHPTELFATLTKDVDNVMLLESSEIDSKDDMQSLLLISSALKIVCRDRDVTFDALNDNGRALIAPLIKHFKNCVVASDKNSMTLNFPHPSNTLCQDARLQATSPFSALRDLNTLLSQDEHDSHRYIAGTFAYDMIASIESLPLVEDG